MDGRALKWPGEKWLLRWLSKCQLTVDSWKISSIWQRIKKEEWKKKNVCYGMSNKAITHSKQFRLLILFCIFLSMFAIENCKKCFCGKNVLHQVVSAENYVNFFLLAKSFIHGFSFIFVLFFISNAIIIFSLRKHIKMKRANEFTISKWRHTFHQWWAIETEARRKGGKSLSSISRLI